MARPLRIEYPGAWYHITSRGNEQKDIFYDDRDRRVFLKILKESTEAFKTEVHCYVLMCNHFHFLLTTPLGNLSRFMQRFNTAYTVYFNKRHNRAGHLLQGRYKSLLIDRDSYLLELSRYIHLNPIRTDIFNDKLPEEKATFLENYKWSSYPSYVCASRKVDFIHTDLISSMTARDPLSASEEYRRFVLKGLKEDISSPLKGKRGEIVLGRPDFIKWAYKTFIDRNREKKEYSNLAHSLPLFTRDQIARCIGEEFGAPPEEIIKRRSKHHLERQMLIELCCRYLLGNKNLKEIGEDLGGITVGALGISRKRLQEKLAEDPVLKERFQKTKQKVLSR